MESIGTDTSDHGDTTASEALQTVPTLEAGRDVGDVDIKDENSVQEEDTKATEADEEGIDMNKELFLCGQCNLGFISIEVCKEHMESDHGLNMDSAVTETMVEMPGGGLTPAAPGTKVDASTQVDRKKPGRKSKATLALEAAEKKEREEKEEQEAKEYIIEEEDEYPDSPLSDTDLEENKYYNWSTRTREGKRKVKPPKSLTDDYYLVVEKSKTAVDMRRKVKSKYNLRCTRKACLAKFKTEEGLTLHDSCHNEPGSASPYTCPTCNSNFDKWPVVKNHLWTAHQQDADLFACEQCAFRTDILHKLEVHLETHTDAKPLFVCEACSKSFKQRAQLELHEGTCDGILKRPREVPRSRQHICPFCKRSYTSGGSLKTHIQTVHEKNRTFACPQCPYTSTRKAMAEMHIRTHTGEKPYKCDQCDFATGDHNSFRRHRMRHSGQRPYKCNHCTYTCIQAASLKVHIKKSHPGADGVFSCTKCSYRTVNEHNWQQHEQNHHHSGGVGRPAGRKHQVQGGEPAPKRFRIHIPPAIPPGNTATGQQPQQAPGPAGKALFSLPGLTRIEGAEGVSEKQAQLICSAINMLTKQMNPGNAISPEKISVKIHQPAAPIEGVPSKEVYVISTGTQDQADSSQQAPVHVVQSEQPSPAPAQAVQHLQVQPAPSSQQTDSGSPQRISVWLPEGMALQTVDALPENAQGEPGDYDTGNTEAAKDLITGEVEDNTDPPVATVISTEGSTEPQNLTELTAVTVASQMVPGVTMVGNNTEGEDIVIAGSSTSSPMTVLEGVESVSEFVVAGSSSPVQEPVDETEQTVYHVTSVEGTEEVSEHQVL